MVIVNASFSGNGTTLTGHSNAAQPVRGGTTDVGDIAVTPTTFETNLGTKLQTCDFCDVFVPLPFPDGFPIGGGTVQAVYVSNSYIWTQQGDRIEALCCPGLFSDASDPLSGRYVNDTLPGRVVVTWYHMRTNGGRWRRGMTRRRKSSCSTMGASNSGIRTSPSPGYVETGLSVANARNTVQVDFSAGPISLPFPENVHENFNPYDHPFDLAGGFVSFTPNAGGGYDILPVPDITAPVCSVTAVSGTVFLEGEKIQVVANATDNGSIAHVHFLSSTNDLDVDLTAAPYQVPFVVPVGATSITFNVTAFDGWGNAACARARCRSCPIRGRRSSAA